LLIVLQNNENNGKQTETNASALARQEIAGDGEDAGGWRVTRLKTGGKTKANGKKISRGY